MSDDTLNSDVNDADNSPKALREALEKANKKNAELQKFVEEVQAEKRNAQLTEILRSKGLKESVAKHFTGEVSEENVISWATDLGLLGTEEAKDANSEAAARASLAAGGSSSLTAGASAGETGRVVVDPYKAMELMATAGFTYEDGVRLGVFPSNPDVVGYQH